MRKYILALIISAFCASNTPAQPYLWQNKVSIYQHLRAYQLIQSAYSDGYGQHVLVATNNGGPMCYHLFGNDGHSV